MKRIRDVGAIKERERFIEEIACSLKIGSCYKQASVLYNELEKGNLDIADFLLEEFLEASKSNKFLKSAVAYRLASKGHLKSIMLILDLYVLEPRKFGVILSQIIGKLLQNSGNGYSDEMKFVLGLLIAFGIGTYADMDVVRRVLENNNEDKQNVVNEILLKFAHDYDSATMARENALKEYKIRLKGDEIKEIENTEISAFKLLLEDILNSRVCITSNLDYIYNKKTHDIYNNYRYRKHYDDSYCSHKPKLEFEIISKVLKAFEIKKSVEMRDLNLDNEYYASDLHDEDAQDIAYDRAIQELCIRNEYGFLLEKF